MSETVIREAPFALRVVQRTGGLAGIVYRRRADESGRDRLQRVGAIAPLAFSAGASLLRDAAKRTNVEARGTNGNGFRWQAAAFYPLDGDWGARLACYALVAAGLRDGERLLKAAGHLRAADGTEAAWWLGLLTREDNVRALRALRILTEAVE